MMPKDMSQKALEAHVEGYIDQLRASFLQESKPVSDEVIEALASMYRSGWRDADEMFRAWGLMQ